MEELFAIFDGKSSQFESNSDIITEDLIDDPPKRYHISEVSRKIGHLDSIALD